MLSLKLWTRCPAVSNSEVLHPRIGQAKLVQMSQAVGVDAVLRLDWVVQTAVPDLGCDAAAAFALAATSVHASMS